MTLHDPVRQGALTLEQWQQLEALAHGLTPLQARWISGYFAGFDAGLHAGADAEVADDRQVQARALTILVGSETGNGRNLAKGLVAEADERGLSPTLADMAHYKVRQIKDEQDLVIIISTHGEGDPPEPAATFFEFIESARAPRLAGVRFSILALGDSTYEHYCEAGKRLDRRLEELGATRLLDRIDCDVDYDEPAAAWRNALLERLTGEAAISMPRAARAAPSAVGPARYHKGDPFLATVLENIPVVGRQSTKETRHIELDVAGSGLAYQPGDSLGILALNDERVAEDLLAATGLSGEAEVTVRNSPMSLKSALMQRFEISVATPRFLEQWAKLSGSSELDALAAPQAAAERQKFLVGHHVIDIVRRFPVSGINPENLLAGLRSLQPRLYSLASSQALVGEEAHITVAPVRYELHGSPRGGVASTYIADRLAMGDKVPVYVQENPDFRLPPDGTAIIMIGPGTGVAPFRAFLQEREARAAAGRSWLFFGERNLRSDFLYQTEWQQWLKDGVLSRLDVAFSRDGADKLYVQHRMCERSRELYAWLEEGAHLYVCGDEKNMSRDVHQMLIELVAHEGDRSRDAAEDYVRGLSAEHRYHKDVY